MIKHKTKLLKLNKSGSSMIYVLMLMMVFSIFSVAVLSVGASYHQRSINEVNAKQAYLNARSVVDLVASDLNKNAALYAQIENAGLVGVVISGFEVDGKVIDAKVAAVHFKDDNSITLIGRATVGNEKKAVGLNLKRASSSGDGVVKDPIIPNVNQKFVLDNQTVQQYFVNPPIVNTVSSFEVESSSGFWIDETLYFNLKNDIYIHVKNNGILSIKDIVLTGGKYNIFIILGNNSELTLGSAMGTTVPIYIYGKKGTVRVENDIYISGYMVVDRVVSAKSTITPLNQTPNNPDMDIGGSKVNIWAKDEYWNVQ